MGAREFTDEAERERRRDLVRRIGDAAFGARLGREGEDGHKGVWHADFARAIEAATGRAIGRPRVTQWLISTADAKSVPKWVVEALPAIARAAAADLRERANRLDGLAVESGSPPEDRGEPEPEPEAAGEPPQESGPAAAQAAEEEVDIDAFVRAYAHVPMPRPAPEPAPEPAPPTGWRSRWAEEHNARWRGVIPR